MGYTFLWLVVVIMQHRLSEARFLHSPFMFQEAEFLSQFDKKDVQDVDVCSTAECLAAAVELKASMNLSVDPCQDFYQFSCGGWVKDHPVPATESHINQFNLVSKTLYFQLREMLESPNEKEDPLPVRNSKQFYTACMDTDKVEARGLKPLSELLKQFGGWPMTQKRWDQKLFNWQTMSSEVIRRWGLAPLVFFYVGPDRKNSNITVITIDQPSLVLPRSMLVDSVVYKKQLTAYVHWVAGSAQLLSRHTGEDVSEDMAYQDAANVVQFEMELAKLTAPNEMRRDGRRMYNDMTLRQLQQWTDSAVIENPVIDWLAMVKGIFNDTDIKIEYSERIVVRELDFLFKLTQLIETSSPRTVANYMHWRLVKLLNRDLNNKIAELSFEFDKVLSGATEDLPRWEECVLATNSLWRYAVAYKYVQLHFDDEAKQSALEMVGNLRAGLLEQLDNVSWMDEDTRVAAKTKVRQMTQFIGYPHWFSNQTYLEQYYNELTAGADHLENVEKGKHFQVLKHFTKLRQPTDRYEWSASPAVVNAYIDFQLNAIIFPAGILQPPFFGKGRTEALNYGGIGVVIGHEITHAFDDLGRQSDGLGNLAQWWTDGTVERYLDKAKCFVKQYNGYRVPQLDEMLMKTAYMNGVTTLGENMADNGGLHQAFAAYQRYTQTHGPEKRLPGLEQFSPEHLFFIAFARNWCESSTKESLLQEVLSDPHSPHVFRVKGTLTNSPQFAQTFNCPLGSPMNPKSKCTFW
ncbi:neprilysin-4-like [Macrosteles quadrilineatus]|uniref:neprilysin-4-like n=1 Tax=Macrosteles quadrilineatus TaxID=74068 RepID=UPI0023E33203|nr:neprilysin-4-like [Macrosteles quadrilineatus]